MFGAHTCAEPTCAVPVLPEPKQSTGLLILPFTLPFVLTLVGEGVNALVAAGVAVRVVDDHVVCGDGQVNPQLVAGQAALGLRTQRTSQGEVNHRFMGTQSGPQILQMGEKTSA